MTDDEIIKMAREAGLAFEKDAGLDFDNEEYPKIWQTYMNVGKQEIEAFAKLVADKERKACAEICDEYSATGKIEEFDRGWLACAKNVAVAIRARGEQA